MTEEVLERETNEEVANQVVVTFGGQDTKIPLESLSVTMDSTSEEILNSVRDIINEESNGDEENTGFTVRKALNSNTIYVYPKAPAG